MWNTTDSHSWFMSREFMIMLHPLLHIKSPNWSKGVTLCCNKITHCTVDNTSQWVRFSPSVYIQWPYFVLMFTLLVWVEFSSSRLYIRCHFSTFSFVTALQSRMTRQFFSNQPHMIQAHLRRATVLPDLAKYMSELVCQNKPQISESPH